MFFSSTFLILYLFFRKIKFVFKIMTYVSFIFLCQNKAELCMHHMTFILSMFMLSISWMMTSSSSSS